MEPEQPNQPADEMLCTEHLLGDLRGRAVRGGGVMLVSQGIKFTVKIGSTMVLARILVPADFGLVAMVIAIANFVMIFKDAGLSTATVQSPRITREQVTTLFWLNAGLSFAVMAVLMAASPLVARLYGEPRLMLITIGFAVPVLLGGLASQHRAILQRNMRFVALAVTEVVPIVIGVAVAIVLAVRGYGYWALVAMPITTEATATMLCWAMCPWRPGARAPLQECKKLLGFGGNLTGFSVLNYFTRNMDNIVIGATLGPGVLGFYAKSYDLLLMPIRQINMPLNGVVLPALSRLQDEPERFRRFFLRAISLISFATIGIVGIVVADTRNFVLVV